MGCCCGSRKAAGYQPLNNAPDDSASSASQKLSLVPLTKTSPQAVSVSLQPKGGQAINTYDTTTPIYYVIIGRGPAAVIDHTTLRQSAWGRARIGELPVMHIGFGDPWAKYMRHGMGQPPYLLSIPGFRTQPSASAGDTIDGGLNSKTFAGCVDGEMDHLTATYRGTKIENGWVAWIQTRAKELLPGAPATKDWKHIEHEFEGSDAVDDISDALARPYPNFGPDLAPYRLLVFDPVAAKLKFIYAQYIDICTGSGRPQVAVLKDDESGAYGKARTAPWNDPAGWEDEWSERKIMNAVDSIRDEVAFAPGERVLVTQGGGIGLNAAEKSHRDDVDCWLDWVHTTNLLATFVNPRNFTFLKHWSEDRCRISGETNKARLDEADLLPPSNRVRLGSNSVLKSAELPGKVKVTLVSQPGGPGRGNAPPIPAGDAAIRDYFNTSAGLSPQGYFQGSVGYLSLDARPDASCLYDRLILPNGLTPDSTGQPFCFANHLGDTKPILKDARMIALKIGEKIRILGAAALVHPSPDAEVAAAKRESDTFRARLPISAVPDGFILAALNIAEANQYFAARPNENINTAPLEEIEAALLTARVSDPPTTAAAIVANRSKNNGYSSAADLVAKLGIVDTDASAIRSAALKFSY